MAHRFHWYPIQERCNINSKSTREKDINLKDCKTVHLLLGDLTFKILVLTLTWKFVFKKMHPWICSFLRHMFKFRLQAAVFTLSSHWELRTWSSQKFLRPRSLWAAVAANRKKGTWISAEQSNLPCLTLLWEPEIATKARMLAKSVPVNVLNLPSLLGARSVSNPEALSFLNHNTGLKTPKLIYLPCTSRLTPVV